MNIKENGLYRAEDGSIWRFSVENNQGTHVVMYNGELRVVVDSRTGKSLTPYRTNIIHYLPKEDYPEEYL